MSRHGWRGILVVLRVVGSNMLFIVAILLLVGVAGEAYLRWRTPFRGEPVPWRFVPGVGPVYKANSEFRFTNDLAYWTIQRTNSLGFLDREPIDPERAPESCHITILGDSFVNAKEVQIDEKVQVRLEEIAAIEAPDMNLTTSAFGLDGTGQINQLALYDGYARHLSPDLVVLVFIVNDPWENLPILQSLVYGTDPDYSPRTHVVREAEGGFSLRPPDPDFSEYRLPSPAEAQPSWTVRVSADLKRTSRFLRWLDIQLGGFLPSASRSNRFTTWVDYLKQRPNHSYILENWSVETPVVMREAVNRGVGSALHREAWDATVFGLEQFKRRAEHDGASLLILTQAHLDDEYDPTFNSLMEIAASLEIPVISQREYILSVGGDIEDTWFNYDAHWTPAGHRWAAEAIWRHIEEEWNGECPSVEPDSKIYIDWIKVGHDIHTPEGKIWSDMFPKDLDAYRAGYESVASDSPAGVSDWDVYVYSEGITYVKEVCTVEDTHAPFFLHVIPENMNDLPEHAKDRGFDNLGFYFYIRGAMFDGRCLISADLPDYDISSISTGQFDDDFQIWKVDYNLNLPEILGAVLELQGSGREPEIRSNFDVYVDDDQLVYAKDVCSADDRDLPFFVHVFPADENHLNDGRKKFGFDNLDFELMQNGGESDGMCFAVVDLPEYDISSIRTGQWVRDEGEVWEASIEFE